MAQKSEQMGMHTEQLAGRTQQRFFSPEEDENFVYPGSFDVDFNMRAELDAASLDSKEINLKLRELMSQGYGTIVMKNPGAKHALGVGILNRLQLYIEDVEGAEILSIGHGLELIKDLGDAGRVSQQYGLPGFNGTHAIGHTRMATESDVDIRSAHPYWAYPFADVAVVHNGQLTNYWKGRRALEHRGHRFVSNCDSELIAVYLADRMQQGAALDDAMRDSIDELDGVFTYLVATADSLGMAKDVMAAKPMVLYESDRFIALASEEVAIRSIFPHEIDTFDPYEGEVRVWKS